MLSNYPNKTKFCYSDRYLQLVDQINKTFLSVTHMRDPMNGCSYISHCNPVKQSSNKCSAFGRSLGGKKQNLCQTKFKIVFKSLSLRLRRNISLASNRERYLHYIMSTMTRDFRLQVSSK